MDIVSYALSKKIAASAVSGIANLQVQDNTLIITTNDGQILNMTFPLPKNGTSITDIEINDQGHLICTMSDNNIIDAGLVPTVEGKTPIKGVDYMTEEDIEEIAAAAQIQWKTIE